MIRSLLHINNHEALARVVLETGLQKMRKLALPVRWLRLTLIFFVCKYLEDSAERSETLVDKVGLVVQILGFLFGSRRFCVLIEKL